MPPIKPSGMPPMPVKPTGPQTSDRWGNVISTGPSTQPTTQPTETHTTAPTSDRWGNIITPGSQPKDTFHPAPPVKPSTSGSGMPPAPVKPTGPQTSDRWGNVISTGPAPTQQPTPKSPGEIAAAYRAIVVPALRAGQTEKLQGAPVQNPDSYPHYNVMPSYMGTPTDVYAVDGKVYAKVAASGGDQWFHVPNCPIFQ